MKKQILFICCAVIAYCLSACNTAPQQVPLKEKNLPKHVILIGFDGLSAHCLNNGADMPTFRKMMAEGASTLENRSILPSSSACNWASMFMGAGPELHGYTEWGSRTPELPSRVVNSDNRFPNIFGMYRDKAPEAEIGYIYEWEGMNYLVDTLAMSFRKHAPMSAENPNGCTPVAVQYIKEKKPNLCAIIYDQPDGTGHGKGWSSPEYFAMVRWLTYWTYRSRRCGSPVRYYQLSRIIKNIDHEESYLFFYFSFLRRINLTGGDNGGCHL